MHGHGARWGGRDMGGETKRHGQEVAAGWGGGRVGAGGTRGLSLVFGQVTEASLGGVKVACRTRRLGHGEGPECSFWCCWFEVNGPLRRAAVSTLKHTPHIW